MSTKRPIASLKPNTLNPRKITQEKRDMLQKTLERFGDLSGIIYNTRTKQLVGGHQRTDAFNKADAQVTITQAFERPTDKGTIALGYVEAHGERFAYREVDWDANTERAANLAANNAVGNWDMPKVASMLQDLDTSGFDMDLTLFDARELKMFSYELPHVPQAYAARDEPQRTEAEGYIETEHLPDGPVNFSMPSEQGKARGQDKDTEIDVKDFEQFAAQCPRCNFHFNPK